MERLLFKVQTIAYIHVHVQLYLFWAVTVFYDHSILIGGPDGGPASRAPLADQMFLDFM